MHIQLLVPSAIFCKKRCSRVAYTAPLVNTQRSKQPLTLAQAVDNAPTLARLIELGRQSKAMLDAISHLIPRPLIGSVTAGPIEQDCWCLLVSNNSAAAKIRQLLPQLQLQLRAKGYEINAIRLKVQVGGAR
jgi:hypothetical protein